MKKKTAIFMTLVMCFMLCSNITVTKAAAETSTITVNGIQRTLIYEDDVLSMQIGNEDPIRLTSGDITYGFDRYGGVWKLIKGETLPMWWSYELIYPNKFFQSISISTGEVDDVQSFIFEYAGGQKFVVGYKTLSGGTYPLPTFEEMQESSGSSDVPIPSVSPEPPDVVVPTPTPSATPTPTPIPSLEPTSTPSITPTPIPTSTPTNTEKPVVTPKPTVSPQTTVASKVSLKKQSGYNCLSVGNKVVSKYKLKKGVLTWKGTKKSLKIKQVKQAGFIKKSKNLIYITKKGKAYTISQKGKKKTILKKGAKKLIFKNGYVAKIKKKSGYTSVVNK